MSEHTPINLTWKYHGSIKNMEGRDAWDLIMDGEVVGRVTRLSNELLERCPGRASISLTWKVQYCNLLPWKALAEGLDVEQLFLMSDAGITTAEMDDVFQPVYVTQAKLGKDGALFQYFSYWFPHA